jgi:hypothetical protein
MKQKLGIIGHIDYDRVALAQPYIHDDKMVWRGSTPDAVNVTGDSVSMADIKTKMQYVSEEQWNTMQWRQDQPRTVADTKHHNSSKGTPVKKHKHKKRISKASRKHNR